METFLERDTEEFIWCKIVSDVTSFLGYLAVGMSYFAREPLPYDEYAWPVLWVLWLNARAERLREQRYRS